MKAYVISYDLHREHRDYPKLWDAIKVLKPSRKKLESVWIVHTDWTNNELLKYLSAHIDENDSLYVVRVVDEGVRIRLCARS